MSTIITTLACARLVQNYVCNTSKIVVVLFVRILCSTVRFRLFICSLKVFRVGASDTIRIIIVTACNVVGRKCNTIRLMTAREWRIRYTMHRLTTSEWTTIDLFHGPLIRNRSSNCPIIWKFQSCYDWQNIHWNEFVKSTDFYDVLSFWTSNVPHLIGAVFRVFVVHHT